MSVNDSNYEPQTLPEFRLVSAYLQTLDFVVGKLKEESPYHMLTPQYMIEVDNLRNALFNLRVEFATQLKFQR